MANLPLPPPSAAWQPLLDLALAEDLGSAGDVTSAACLPAGCCLEAVLEARQPLVVCGLEIARAVFARLDPAIHFEASSHDGSHAARGEPLARVSGPGVALLAGERTALNFLARMCGIASWTRRFVEAVAGTGVAIVDTRKTLPGWRSLDKYAVAVGGGSNQRFGLYDGVLIKDNHVAAAGGVAAAVKAARASAPRHLQIQVEVESAAQAEAAVAAGADLLLLDNRSPDELRSLASRFASRLVLEASGGVTLDNVVSIARTGVQRISIGALTHSAPAADVALEVLVGEGRP